MFTDHMGVVLVIRLCMILTQVCDTVLIFSLGRCPSEQLCIVFLKYKGLLLPLGSV